MFFCYAIITPNIKTGSDSMPFMMTHFHIAYNILKTTPQIKKPGEFLLGSIAPDSVHFRKPYDSDMKKLSHLCIGEEKWGYLSNNEVWLDNVLDFLKRNKDGDNQDFFYGYCSHIIADIQNNIKIWTPFKLTEKEAMKNGMGATRYHQEARDVDYTLYLMKPERETIWNLIESAQGYDIPGVVYKSEIEAMKHSVMFEQYQNREAKDISINRYATLDGMKKFIEEESGYIRNLLYPVVEGKGDTE